MGWIDEMRGVKLKISCEVRRGDALLVSGHTVHAFVNQSGRPIRPPEELRKLLE